MAEKRDPPDRRIAGMAAGQHGIVSIRQLSEAGLSGDAVLGRVRQGRLHRLHRGVYAVGHGGLSQEGRWLAAVLASGEGALLSFRSAAALWGLLPVASGPVDVSQPARSGRRRRAGIRLHRCGTLTAEQATGRRGIPVTTLPRTIVDLSRTVRPTELRRAMRQAEILGFEVDADDGNEGTRSELEAQFLRLCRRHRLPEPEVNVRVGSLLVDFLWRDRRLVVETDGYRYHRGRTAFEDDHDRDLRLRSLGYVVARFTHRQVMEEPERVAAALRRELGSRGSPSSAAGRRRRPAT